ncbi:hypothetical protein LNO36_20675 [Klebsiella variicola subsp. variicola]|nr:hypothetical protein [Klebsiella variicola subsp. variicola]
MGAVQVDDCDQIMMITDAGTLVRTRVSEVSIVGRNTQGVILIRTAEDENVVGLQRVAEPVDDEELDAIDGSVARKAMTISPRKRIPMTTSPKTKSNRPGKCSERAGYSPGPFCIKIAAKPVYRYFNPILLSP